MVTSTILTIVVLIFFLIVIVGSILLESFLSKKDSKWFGLILPLIFFSFSLLNVMNIMNTGNLINNIILIVSTFVGTNIPTIILLTIYFANRNKKKRKYQLEKMSIQDLQ